jgi:hypothetical protein
MSRKISAAYSYLDFCSVAINPNWRTLTPVGALEITTFWDVTEKVYCAMPYFSKHYFRFYISLPAGHSGGAV